MCLLTFHPAGLMPDTAALLNGASINNDGHGFAIVATDQIITRRGLDAERMVEEFNELRHQHPDGPALFHSRLGTHGKRSIDNCHPFPVGGDWRTVLAHNGVLPENVQPEKGDPRSDTRIVAEVFLPVLGSLRFRRIRLRFERWMTPDNMMVVLTVDPRFKRRAYIFNEQSGVWDGGVWYSNDGYSALSPIQRTMRNQVWWNWPPRDWPGHTTSHCGYCCADISPTLDECPYCGLCLDCGEIPDNCFCYTPAVLDRQFGGTRRRPV